jgi:cytochrome c1
MRESYARGAALATAVVVVGAVVLFAALQSSDEKEAQEAQGAQEEQEEQVPPPDTLVVFGQRVYDEEGCAACHSIGGVGGRRAALDGVGSRISSDTIRLWIVDPQAVRPGIRKPSYPDLSEERLVALIAFLESLAEP